MSFDKWPIVVEEESLLTLDLMEEVANKEVLQIAGSVEGVSMYMGKVPVTFSQTDIHQYSGVFFLGSCSEPNMTWQMTIDVLFKDGSNAKKVLQFTTVLS